ncbi:MAG TPA: hypothetical protein VJN96_06770 [Vicinamibacterales bacterium]|nr:hypothetical protein [Vicinamibacterales bacterium]
MRRSALTASLSIALLAGAAPAFGGPVHIGDASAPFAGWSVDTVPGTEDVPLDRVSEERPVLCAWPVVEDDSAPGLHVEVPSADLLPPADLDGRVKLIDDVVDCSGDAGAAAPRESQSWRLERGSRFRSVLQTLAIMSALAAIAGLGWFVAALVRRTSHDVRRYR